MELAGATAKVAAEEGTAVAKEVLTILEKNPELIEKAGGIEEAVGLVKKGIGVGSKLNEANRRGKAFEEFLVKKLGGRGSFTYLDREFDGAFGNVWYEAKSGAYWEVLLENKKILDKFQSDMGRGLSYALKNGASYELHSDVPVPHSIKDWLVKKGIKVVEWPNI